MGTVTTDLTPAERRLAAGRVHWSRQARAEQLAPEGDWYIWFLRGGRGAGKTRSGAEWLADELAYDSAGDVSAIIAPTFGEGRDKCVEGPSGLRDALYRRGIAHHWNRSLGELWLGSGAKVIVDEAFTGAVKVQGENLRRAWCDELRNWRRGWAEKAWDESLLPAVRMGRPRIVVTSTPGRTPLVRRLIADAGVHVSHMTMFDNARNLAPEFIAQMRSRYEGTRLGRQELYGELIEDVEGALWTDAMIGRADALPTPWAQAPIVGVDPSDGDEDSDEQAYTVAGLCMDQRLYVVESEGFRIRPYEFACKVVRATGAHHGRMVVEKNHGGGYLVETIKRAMRDLDMPVPLNVVHAAEGKRMRAEPVAALYEQGRVSHVGSFPELEDQMTSWTGTERYSPDRLDSLVWALSEFTQHSFKPFNAFQGHGEAVPYPDGEVRGVPDGAVAWR